MNDIFHGRESQTTDNWREKGCLNCIKSLILQIFSHFSSSSDSQGEGSENIAISKIEETATNQEKTNPSSNSNSTNILQPQKTVNQIDFNFNDYNSVVHTCNTYHQLFFFFFFFNF